MKNNVTRCLLGFLMLASVTVAHAQQTGTEKTIADLENKWLQSQKTNNPDLAAPVG